LKMLNNLTAEKHLEDSFHSLVDRIGSWADTQALLQTSEEYLVATSKHEEKPRSNDDDKSEQKFQIGLSDAKLDLVLDTPILAIAFDIEAREGVTGGNPGGIIGAGVNPNSRLVNFVLPEWVDKAEFSSQWKDDRTVWLVIHGWNDKPSRFGELVKAVGEAKPSDIVLTLDWSQAAFNSDGSRVSDITNQRNGIAASWIASVAQWAAQKLKNWGLTDGNKLNLIGHSLGSILSAEIASYFGNVNSIIALEPPSDANLIGIQGQDPSKYDVNFTTPGRQAPKRFSDVSTFSRAFVGSKSIAADATYAATAQESILMDFGTPLLDDGSEHGWVVDTFSQLIATNPSQRKLANDLLSLNNNSRNSGFKDNSYSGELSFVRAFEGVVRVNKPTTVVSFTARKNTPNSQDELIYGTNQNDSLVGGSGNDDMFGGEGNDSLLGVGGSDRLLGGEGNDNLTGGSNGDQFIFDIDTFFKTSKIGVDIVIDFAMGIDKFVLDKTTFTSLVSSAGGALVASEFAVTNSRSLSGASDAKIAFDRLNSELFYNANGSAPGFGDGGRFARLVGVNSLSASDFIIRA
jgi:pimeloyl-ACP methyl ester carboxylesterase